MLTAAHCVCFMQHSVAAKKCIVQPFIEEVVLGDHNQLEVDDGEIYIRVSSIIAHEKSFTGNLILISLMVNSEFLWLRLTIDILLLLFCSGWSSNDKLRHRRNSFRKGGCTK